MLDSAARAERIDIPASEAAFYTWEVAQKPVAVRLPLAFIDRLESEAVENFRSLSSRGSEIGGVLLGSVVPGNPAVVSVSDYELLPCEYTRGPLYRLSDAEMARMEETIEKHRTAAQRVVAFFRSHTRKGLALDADDLAFFEPRFSEPHQFVLLVRPFATKVSTAGIFIRENGKVALEASSKEFSFRSSELGAAAAPAEKSEAAASAPSAPKAQPRAQIVPIASRREIALPEPVSVPTPAPVAPEKVEAAVAPAPAAPAPKPAEEKAAAAPAPAVDLTPKPAEKPVEKSAEMPVLPVKAAVEVAEPVVVQKSSKKLKMVVAAALGMVALVGGGLFLYPSLMKHETRPPAVSPQDSSPLSLRVERTSGGMLLTWNRDLPVIQSATKVVLAISDGDRHENIELDPNQVRTGSILYPPITGDVSFQMEVTDAHQSKTTSESLRVLDPRPSPLDTPAAPAGSATAKDSTPAKSAPNTPGTTAAATPAPDDPKPTTDDASAKPAPAPLKHFDASSLSLAERLRPATSNDLPEAPPVVRASPTGAVSLPGIVTSQPAMPPPAAPKQVPAPVIATGGQLVPARVISRVDPEYPKLAKQAGASGVVELEATIGVDGKVRNPRVVHGNAMLQKAASDAVLQWRYKPAMLNGKPVESPVDIKLEFEVQH